MTTQIKTATIYVSDQDAALDFYANKLGFEVRSDEAFGPGFRWIVVAPPGQETGLVLAKGFGEESRIGAFTGIVIGSDDVQGTYEQWSALGVKFTEPPTEQPWGGIQALFDDQDGNHYVLHS